MGKLILLVVAFSLLCACTVTQQATTSDESGMTGTLPERTFRVVGYATSAVIVDAIQFDKLTHINYAFLIPNADGTFELLANAWKLEQIVSRAHEHGAKVLISVGGWGWDTEFEMLAASPETRATFVSELVQFVSEYNLDGADIGWEFPDPGQSAQNFIALMSELRAALPDKLLTIAAVAYGETGGGIPDETFDLVDFVNIMAYDGEGTNHSSMEYAQQALDYWLGRGLPQDKAVLGVPFYARPNGTPYYNIIRVDPQAANVDFFTYYGVELNYNGIPTIQAKTRLALERASGIMIWTIEHDVTNELSLLSAIDRAVHGE